MMNASKVAASIGLALFFAHGVAAGGVQQLDAADVRLLPGSPFYDRQQLHRKGYLASLDCDKLLFHYRALAGLPQPEGVRGAYGGWDSGFIRGHMAGHYLSAASRMTGATGETSFGEKVDYMVTELAKCQDALKQDGYLAAFPSGAFDRLEGKGGKSGGVVVPYYTIHKIMAGLLDAHRYVGNEQALQVAVRMADYFEARLAALDAEQLEKMFRTDRSQNPHNEFGAMSDVLAELYEVTGDQKHLNAAQLFNRSWFIDPLARGEDRLAGLHGNTHVAQAIGIAHCANLTGDATEAKASENFWDIVTREHSFVIGGDTFKEWFDKASVETGPSIDGRQELPATTAESCNTHNMLKLTARLFERTPDAKYANYSERALYNHLLATVAPDTGAMTYFLPLRGNFRTYLDATHCCVGSGIENTPRYNEGIYFQQDDSLWVNLYIPSELNWRETGIVLRQGGVTSRAGSPRNSRLSRRGKHCRNNLPSHGRECTCCQDCSPRGDRGMTKGITVKRQFHVRLGRSNRRLVRAGANPNMPIGRPPRISRLMALAIWFDQLLRTGRVSDQAELARIGRVSRARLTQIANLLSLAPDIQQEILEMSSVRCGRGRFSERVMRPIASQLCWRKQRQLWRILHC